ncbi:MULTISPECIES: hypothetical protein [Pseudoalteromonas]|uniref:hypothetical protein n=1 Tax=Pseudoalteromonas TaxID=53246 RepID=UPI0015841FA1|nr:MULTISPECIES: hypothetical protein [Pseudoalteromonas]MDI4654582.1 hypothetical protein [Pseudoalteromonas shioyasakiensis]NUJ40149.1 hypothetical protein [Pseudoalteromonas sp. 0303]
MNGFMKLCFCVVCVFGFLALGAGIPRNFNGATVIIQDCKSQSTESGFCEYEGYLEQSWTGSYFMRVRQDTFLQFNKDSLIDQGDNKFVFSSGYLRQDTVIVHN